jgi:hypothetical protein
LAHWYQGNLTLGVLFLPHNEHRVVLTKLVNLGLTVANGQWDQRLEAAVNATLPALIAVGFYLFGLRFLGRLHAPLFIFLAAAFGLPFAWHNVIAGFNSQQFFLIGLSFGAIAALSAALPWSRRWWLGATCMTLAMISMASGFFAAAVVLGLMLLFLIRREITWSAAAPTLLLAAILVAIGCLTRVTVPGHEAEMAHSVGDFASALVQSLEWPARKLINLWLIGILWLPWCLLAWRFLKRQAGDGRESGAILLGLGAWVILQLLATACARGVEGRPPASRYIDTLVFGVVVNGLALGWLACFGRTDLAARATRAFIALAWIGIVIGGSDDQLKRIIPHELPYEGAYHRICIENVRNYLATGDINYLRHYQIPYPGTDLFLKRLLVPSLRSALPVSVRDPIRLTAHRTEGSFQMEDSRAPENRSSAPRQNPPAGLPPGMPPLPNAVTWGSFGTNGSAGLGSWESDPVPALNGGWLKFEVAGQVGATGLSLEIRDAATRRVLAEMRPAEQPGNSWRAAYVRAPASPFIITARDDDPAGWLAFSEPAEMGMLSYIAWNAVQNGLPLAEIAAGCGIILCLAAWRFSLIP